MTTLHKSADGKQCRSLNYALLSTRYAAQRQA
jgi:hypothetical protein